MDIPENLLNYDSYFVDLADLVGLDYDLYSDLLMVMYETDFVWALDLDEDRVDDGLLLREELAVSKPEKPCSVLEVLIGIARRMDYILSDDISGDRTRVWFWEMVENLGLKTWTNLIIWHTPGARFSIQTVLNRWMTRCFEVDGTGSIFPLKYPKYDQRDQTITYQMNAYILENYLFEEN